MLKIVFRIVCILLVAGIVSAGWYLLVNNTGSAGLPAGNIDGGQRFDRPAFDNGQPPAGFNRGEGFHGDRDLQGGSLLGAVGILGNLGKVAAITALVMLVQRLVAKITRRRAPVQTA